MKKNGLTQNSVLSEKAYTLIEIVLVIAIVGVIFMLLLDFMDTIGGFVKPDISKANLEFQIRFASDFVSGEVIDASELIIGTVPPDGAEGYNRIEVIDHQIIYTPITGESMVLTDAIIMNPDTDVTFSFIKDSLSSTLSMKIIGSSGANIFPLESSVTLKYINTESDGTGKIVYFKKSDESSAAITTTLMSESGTSTVTTSVPVEMMTTTDGTVVTTATLQTIATTLTAASNETTTPQTTTTKVSTTTQTTTMKATISSKAATTTLKVTTTKRPTTTTTTKKPTPTTSTTSAPITTSKPAAKPYTIIVSVNNESLSYFSNNTFAYRNQGDNAVVSMTVTGATLISDNPQTIRVAEPKTFSVRLSNGDVVNYTFYSN